MKNLVKQPGDELTYANSGTAIKSGDVVVIASGAGGMIGVAQGDIAQNAEGSVVVKNRIVEVAADDSTAFDQGDKLYWDANNGELVKSSTGNTPAGRAAAAKSQSAATAQLIINMP